MIKPKINLARLRIRNASPTILIGVGIVSTVAGVIVACTATTKLDEVKARHRKRLDDIHAKYDDTDDEDLINPVEETEVAEVEQPKDIKKETTVAFIKTGLDYAKLYAPAAGLILLGLGSFLVSHRILNKRYFTALAMYNTEAAAFRRYRQNVIEQEGKEKDANYFLGKGQKKTIEMETVDEDGNEIVTKKQATIVDENGDVIELSDQAIIFSRETSDQWDTNEYYNRTFINGQLDILRLMWHDQGFISKNDAHGALDVKKNDAGQWIGWLNNEPDWEVYERWAPNGAGGYESFYIIDFIGLEVIANQIDKIEQNK